ncbi:MAG: hypothetical protein QOI47_617 [Actinomycetota bacterium]|nr:hypothetical protein [Actinomycetota bacterium]
METHYNVLGVTSSATTEQVRHAYYDRARQLHPDVCGGRPVDEIVAARRAMQDVNEAWRVLREPGSRAAYDRSLRAASAPTAPPDPVDGDGDDWMDRPYARRAAEPGDLAVALVRAAPWIAVIIVLGAIFVFTAFARHTASKTDLIGACITTTEGAPKQVPCSQPNEGRVVLIVQEQSLCPTGSDSRVVAGGAWYCLRPADSR